MLNLIRTVLAGALIASAAQAVQAGGYERIDKERGVVTDGRGQKFAYHTPGNPPTQEGDWLLYLLDAARSGEAFKRPEVFLEWLDALSEPRIMTALATVAVDPIAYPRLLARAIEPTNTLNWSEFNDPALYLRWLAAGSNPAFFQAILNRMANSGKFMRWLQVPQALMPVLGRYNPADSAQGAAPVLQPVAAPSSKGVVPATYRQDEDWYRLTSERSGGFLTSARNYRY